MQLVRVGAASLNQTPLDWEGNKRRIIEKINEAKAQRVGLLVLPELAISGYGCEDAFLSMETTRCAEKVLSEILPYTDGIAVAIGLPRYYRGALYNCVAMVHNQSVIGLNAKQHLPREGVHYEPRWFRPWMQEVVEETSICQARVPMGDLRYRFGRVGVAVEICEEAWVRVPSAASHAEGVELVINPSASHFSLGRYRTREQLVANSSRALGVHYVYTNLTGLESGRIIYDGSVLFARDGEITKRGPRLRLGEGQLLYADLDMDLARLDKMKNTSVSDLVAGTPGHEVVCDPLPEVRLQESSSSAEGQKNAARSDELLGDDALSPEAEFLLAEVVGLFDYLRKSGAQGYAVSVSGGCDSSATVLLVAHMVAEGFRQLGESKFLQLLGTKHARRRLERIPVGVEEVEPSEKEGGNSLPLSDSDRARIHEVVRELLHCAYQKTDHSSDATQTAARTVCEEIGANYHLFDVQPLVDCYLDAYAEGTGTRFDWERTQEDPATDIVLQNIQARTRSPMIWMLANATGSVLLTTSNRSEASMGYATMDGDTSGGLAPLGGIDKDFLRHWLRWAESECRLGLGPVASLENVNALAPSAELRPPSQEQTDEEDLMPYDVLNFIECCLIRERKSPTEIFERMQAQFGDVAEEQLQSWINRFLRLWHSNQWKRERLAPSFHLDDRNVDPKTWCRFPILAGPARELSR